VGEVLSLNKTIIQSAETRKRRKIDFVIKLVIWASGLSSAGVLLWILGYIVTNGMSALNWTFLFGEGGHVKGIVPQIVSTLYLIGLALLIATPMGTLTAIFLNEYAKQGKVIRIIRFSIECLAGIPSIIYGLFGMIFFVIYLKLNYSLLAGALTVTIMILPTIIRTTEEALKTVPISYREGSLGLGASKIRTIFKVILPSAYSGIFTSVILSIGRIVGETAAVYLTAGMVARVPESVMDSGRSLAVHLYMLAHEGISMEQAFATATVLIAIVFFINISTNALSKKISR